jgi:CheY-like chemotaxis protein
MQERRSRPRTRRLLVVDDHQDFREMLWQWFTGLGFSVCAVGNGCEAVRAASTMRPEVVLMDLAMPVMDGFEATRRLREQPATSDVPILAVSATASTADRARAAECGASAFIPKPLDFDALLEAVREALRTKH